MKGIPKLNAWQAKFGPRGFSIVGVTDEAPNVVEPFLQAHELNYLVALGGAGLYKERRLPHAWLIDPLGDVVWEGNPADLGEAALEEHLVGAWNPPALELPIALHRVRLLVATERYQKAMSQLGKVAGNERSASRDAAAKALAQIIAFGEAQLALVKTQSEGGRHGPALGRLSRLMKNFGTAPVGEKARELDARLRADPAVVAEVEAYILLRDARERLARRDRTGALAKLTEAAAGSHAETRSGKEAARRLAEIEKR